MPNLNDSLFDLNKLAEKLGCSVEALQAGIADATPDKNVITKELNYTFVAFEKALVEYIRAIDAAARAENAKNDLKAKYARLTEKALAAGLPKPKDLTLKLSDEKKRALVAEAEAREEEQATKDMPVAPVRRPGQK